MSSSTTPPGTLTFQLFDSKHLCLTPTFLEQLKASSCPLIVVLCGTSGCGKSRLGNQLLLGRQDQELDDYDTPFQVADGATPMTSGIQVAPPLKLKDLLSRHGCADQLARYSSLSGDEDVFVVDTEGLARADRPQTATPLIQQLVALLSCATGCLYVTRSIPSPADMEGVSSIVKLCNMVNKQGATCDKGHLKVCLMAKDVVSLKAGMDQGAAKCSQLNEAVGLAHALGNTFEGEQKVGVMCFPQYGQVDSTKYGATAQPLYWGCLQDMLEQLCEHASQTSRQSGALVAERLGEVLNLLQKIKTLFKLERFDDLMWALCSYGLHQVVKDRCEQQVQGIVEHQSSHELKRLRKALGALDTAAETMTGLLMQLDPGLVKEYSKEWPDRWKLEAQQYAQLYEELLEGTHTPHSWWKSIEYVLIQVGFKVGNAGGVTTVYQAIVPDQGAQACMTSHEPTVPEPLAARFQPYSAPAPPTTNVVTHPLPPSVTTLTKPGK